ncbi:hypothetical protein WN48_10480 [Eufriesea mexicana]|uniref:Uncharacterized protein n=1 Tax=Eufriesea mexicana TaxID=516756 RepID=A0A310SE92_9HYME|nr:hypothetical protein WN48_10480 [Eufriesea mexicana]
MKDQSNSNNLKKFPSSNKFHEPSRFLWKEQYKIRIGPKASFDASQNLNRSRGIIGRESQTAATNSAPDSYKSSPINQETLALVLSISDSVYIEFASSFRPIPNSQEETNLMDSGEGGHGGCKEPSETRHEVFDVRGRRSWREIDHQGMEGLKEWRVKEELLALIRRGAESLRFLGIVEGARFEVEIGFQSRGLGSVWQFVRGIEESWELPWSLHSRVRRIVKWEFSMVTAGLESFCGYSRRSGEAENSRFSSRRVVRSKFFAGAADIRGLEPCIVNARISIDDENPEKYFTVITKEKNRSVHIPLTIRPAFLTGCFFPSPQSTSGKDFGNGHVDRLHLDGSEKTRLSLLDALGETSPRISVSHKWLLKNLNKCIKSTAALVSLQLFGQFRANRMIMLKERKWMKRKGKDGSGK